jgi:hypothetical protein
LAVDSLRPHRVARTRGSPLTILVGGALIAILLLQLPSDIPTDVRLGAAALWMLYLLPSAAYAARRRESRPPLPTLAILGLAHATYYALPPLVGIVNAAYLPDQFAQIPYVDPTWELPAALEVAFWGWMALLVGYGIAAVIFQERGATGRPLAVPPILGPLWLVAAAGLTVEAAGAVAHLPVVFAGTLGFVKLAGRCALTVLVALRTRRELPRGHGKYLAAFIITEMVILATTGSMANPMIFALTLSFGFWVAGGRLRPRVALAVVAAVLIGVILKGVAAEYRERTWWAPVKLTQMQETAVMGELLNDQLATSGIGGAIVLGAQASMRRSATLDLLADVIRRTPGEIPYWGGKTYYSLVGAFVPRFLWPGKPTKNLGNQFGHRYGYLNTADRWTEVNLPYLLEFYANFGFQGVIVGMLITAFIIRFMDVMLNRPGSSLLRATAALVIIQPVFLIEADFSLVFGGLILNAAAMLFLVRQLEKRAAVTPHSVGGEVPRHLAEAH